MEKEQKHFAKSKTNAAQVPFILILAASLTSDEVRNVICGNGSAIMAVQVFLTVVARNMGGGLRFRRKK